jgi:glycosyltransferase involved in cell wall biosynthesis
LKKILFINQSSELYGSDRTFLLLLHHLDRNSFFPVVILPNEGPLKIELEKLNIEVVIAPVLKLYRDMFRFKNILQFCKDFFSALSILKKLNKKYDFDIVYSNTFAVLIGALFSKKSKIKHIWHVHEIIEHPSIIAWFFPKMAYYFSNLIICNSEATKRNCVQREPRIEKKCMVIYNGVPHLNTMSNSKKTDFGFDENDMIITLVGRISRLKGHVFLLKSFKELVAVYSNLKLLFVGSPVPGQEFYLEDVLNYIKDNKLENSVKILPFSFSLDAIWNCTDIAVMPSTEKESFGLVAAEAMLAKKPVIATNHGGLKEIIQNNSTGFLVEPNSVSELSEAITALINNSELRKQMGEKGHDRIITNFSEKSYIKEMERTLNTL